MKTEAFVIERIFNASIEIVWKAITDKEKMKRWYFDLAEFKPVVGFEFQFEGGEEGKSYLHLCKVTEVIPNKKLQYSWRYDGYAGNSFVTWELFDEGENKTRLKLTHEGLETFPTDNPDLAPHNFAEGWNMIIGTLLREFVETTIIQISVEINASPSKVWNVLTHPSQTIQWANAFSEGSSVESDWNKGSEVKWKDVDGTVVTKGVVAVSEPGRQLKILFYDDVNMTSADPVGSYYEVYSLTPHDSKTILHIESGPLALKDVNTQQEHWEKGIAVMKELAEK